MEELEAGIKSSRYFSGTLRCRSGTRDTAYVNGGQKLEKDILIIGSENINRAGNFQKKSRGRRGEKAFLFVKLMYYVGVYSICIYANRKSYLIFLLLIILLFVYLFWVSAWGYGRRGAFIRK